MYVVHVCVCMCVCSDESSSPVTLHSCICNTDCCAQHTLHHIFHILLRVICNDVSDRWSFKPLSLLALHTRIHTYKYKWWIWSLVIAFANGHCPLMMNVSLTLFTLYGFCIQPTTEYTFNSKFTYIALIYNCAIILLFCVQSPDACDFIGGRSFSIFIINLVILIILANFTVLLLLPLLQSTFYLKHDFFLLSSICETKPLHG